MEYPVHYIQYWNWNKELNKPVKWYCSAKKALRTDIQKGLYLSAISTILMSKQHRPIPVHQWFSAPIIATRCYDHQFSNSASLLTQKS